MKTTKQISYRFSYITLTALLIIVPAIFFTAPHLQAQDRKWDATTHDKTNFPLVGKHRDTPCSECHIKGVMQGTPTQCEECHWQRKQDDRYKLQLGIHCQDCHTPFDWKILKPNSWDHLQVTGYARQGIHKTLDCFQCHKNGAFNGQPSECYDCHREDYREADEPNHVAGNFPTDCEVCHKNQISWEGAAFAHTSFPLSGAHQSAGCSACHVNGQYSGTTRDCSGCHMEDYNNTQNPNHQQAGFPTNCEACHLATHVTWGQAVFNHQFPITTGNHSGFSCTDCHLNANFQTFSCIDCHEHSKGEMDNEHDDVNGYSYNSQACYSCHPQGRED